MDGPLTSLLTSPQEIQSGLLQSETQTQQESDMLLEGQPSHKPAVFHVSNSFQRESSGIGNKEETWETGLHDDLEVGS